MTSKPAALVLAAAVGLAACSGAQSPTGECLGYACDEDGAKAMFWETTEAAYEPSDVAKGHLEKVFARGLATMAKEKGFTPDGFDLARGNLKKFLGEVPEGSDALATEAENLEKGTTKLCPLWPYC
jgi:hypothetical protein